MFYNTVSCTKFTLLAGLLAGSIFVCSTSTNAAQVDGKAAAPRRLPAVSNASQASKVYAPATVAKSQRGADYYRRRWGIDNIVVRYTASGSLIRFSYRVVDATKAAVINDKSKAPFLIEEKTGIALPIPQMEKVGQLRQTSTPENGREYWMAFSNKNKLIKPGSRVDIVIGGFRINDLPVE